MFSSARKTDQPTSKSYVDQKIFDAQLRIVKHPKYYPQTVIYIPPVSNKMTRSEAAQLYAAITNPVDATTPTQGARTSNKTIIPNGERPNASLEQQAHEKEEAQAKIDRLKAGANEKEKDALAYALALGGP